MIQHIPKIQIETCLQLASQGDEELADIFEDDFGGESEWDEETRKNRKRFGQFKDGKPGKLKYPGLKKYGMQLNEHLGELFKLYRSATAKLSGKEKQPYLAAMYYFKNNRGSSGATVFNINSVEKYRKFAEQFFIEGQGSPKKFDQIGQGIRGRIDYFTKVSTTNVYMVGHGSYCREQTNMVEVPENTEIRFYTSHGHPLDSHVANAIEGVTTEKIRKNALKIEWSNHGISRQNPDSMDPYMPRPYEVFGSTSRVFDYFLLSPNTGTKFPINLNGKKLSDFIYVPDVGRGVPLSALLKDTRCTATKGQKKIIHWCACRSYTDTWEVRGRYLYPKKTTDHSWARVEPRAL